MTNPNTHPAPTMVYGGAPMMSDDAPGPRVGNYPYPRPDLAALTDELATLRADNDARGQVIEQLRAERDIARANVAAAGRHNEDLAAELDAVRSERDAALNERDEARAKFDRACQRISTLADDRDKYFAAYNRTLRALNAALGEP